MNGTPQQGQPILIHFPEDEASRSDPSSYPLCEIAYVSRNLIDAFGGDAAAEIDAILTTARRHNARLGITGALFYSSHSFAQVLEGPALAVDCLYARILVDPRHESVTMLHRRPIAQRRFERWTMAYVGLPGLAEQSVAIASMVSARAEAERLENGARMVSILRELTG